MRPKCSDSIETSRQSSPSAWTSCHSPPPCTLKVPKSPRPRSITASGFSSREELVGRLAQLGALHVLVAVVPRRPARAARTSRSRPATSRRSARVGLVVRLDLADVAVEDDLAGVPCPCSFSSSSLDLMFRRTTLARTGPLVPGVQALRERQQLGVIRRDHPHRRTPRSSSPGRRDPTSRGARWRGPTRRASVLRPLVGVLHLRGAGQPRTDPVHQLGGRLHDLGVLEVLLPDLRDHVEVDALLRPGRRERTSASRQAQAARRFRRYLLGTKPRHGITGVFGGQMAVSEGTQRRRIDVASHVARAGKTVAKRWKKRGLPLPFRRPYPYRVEDSRSGEVVTKSRLATDRACSRHRTRAAGFETRISAEPARMTLSRCRMPLHRATGAR